jgi:hypothetical protein
VSRVAGIRRVLPGRELAALLTTVRECRRVFLQAVGLGALVLVLFVWGVVFVATATADTVATCTTDTATSYCEQVASGVDSGGLSAGLDAGLIVLGVMLVFGVGLYVTHRVSEIATQS